MSLRSINPGTPIDIGGCMCERKRQRRDRVRMSKRERDMGERGGEREKGNESVCMRQRENGREVERKRH